MDVRNFQQSPSGQLARAQAGYWAFVPHPLPPQFTWTAGLVAALSEADRAMGELAGVGRMLPNPHLLIRPFVRREAVLSSRIEGTQASLPELYAYEAAQLALFEVPRSADVREVLNYVRALEYGLERLTTLPLSLRLIRELHARLMEGVRGEHSTPGEFRRSQNWIGPPGCTLNDATYVPPPLVQMREALDALERYLYAAASLPPLVNLALIHYQFEAIHPFLDGNGRIGRLLITLLLCQWQLLPQPLLYLSAYFEKHREAYYDGLLQVSREGCWGDWIAFFLRGVETQARDAVVRLQRIQDLQHRYRQQYQSARSSALLLRLIDYLFATPMVTVRQVEEHLGVTFRSAQKHVRTLAEAGILHEVTGRARDRVYAADEIVRTIEEPLEGLQRGSSD